MGHPLLIVGSTIGLAWLFASSGKSGTPGAPGETPFVSDPNAGLQQLGNGQVPTAPFGGLVGPTSMPAETPGYSPKSSTYNPAYSKPDGFTNIDGTPALPFGGGLSGAVDPGGSPLPDDSDLFANNDSGVSVPAADATLPSDDSGDGSSITPFSSVAGAVSGFMMGGPVGALVGACVGALASGAMDRADPKLTRGSFATRGSGSKESRARKAPHPITSSVRLPHPITSSIRLNPDGSTTVSGLVWSPHARGWTH